jgi:hypothetical protein
LTEYRSGCRCPKCTAANREQKRRLRAAKPDAPRNVVSLPTTAQPVAAPGPNELAVRAQCEMMPRAADLPAIVQAAISVAQRLDDPDHAANTARNSHELRDLLSELQGPKRKSGGRLHQISAMSGRRQAL